MGKKKGAGAKGGKNSVMNGRALFQYNPDLFKDEDNEGEAEGPTQAKDEEEKEQADDGDDGDEGQ